MIDINELRRLAQAATPGPWINYGRQSNAPGLPHSAVAAKTLLARVYSEACGDSHQETANASLIAAANPAAISELLDRLEAAERGLDTNKKLVEGLVFALNTSNHERDALRAKIEAMEQQEPVKHEFQSRDGKWYPFIDQRHYENTVADGSWPIRSIYTLPGAQVQPATSVPQGFAWPECPKRRQSHVLFDDGYEEGWAACVAAIKAALAAAPSVPDDVILDAARYRLLRRGQHWSVVDGIGDHLRADALDSAVDGVLTAAPEGKS